MAPAIKVLRWLCISVVMFSAANAQALQKPGDGPKVPECRDGAANVFVRTTVWGVQSKSYIQGLTVDMFRIDGDEGTFDIKCFSSGDEPMDVGFVIDRSSSMSKEFLRLSGGGMRAFIDNSHPDNRYFAVGFDQEAVTLLELTNDPTEVSAFLDKVNGWTRKGKTAIYDALSMSAGKFTTDGSRKKVLIVFADGDDNYSTKGEGAVKKELRAANIRVYFARAEDPQDSYNDTRVNADSRVMRLTAETRGGMISVTLKIGFESHLKAFARSLRNQYTIGINPKKQLNKFQPIIFRVFRPKQSEEVRTNGTGHIFY